MTHTHTHSRSSTFFRNKDRKTPRSCTLSLSFSFQLMKQTEEGGIKARGRYRFFFFKSACSNMWRDESRESSRASSTSAPLSYFFLSFYRSDVGLSSSSQSGRILFHCSPLFTCSVARFGSFSTAFSAPVDLSQQRNASFYTTFNYYFFVLHQRAAPLLSQSACTTRQGPIQSSREQSRPGEGREGTDSTRLTDGRRRGEKGRREKSALRGRRKKGEVEEREREGGKHLVSNRHIPSFLPSFSFSGCIFAFGTNFRCSGRQGCQSCHLVLRSTAYF